MLRRRHKKSRADQAGNGARAASPSSGAGAVPRTAPAVAPALPVFPAPSANNLNANHTDPLLLIDDADAAINVSHAELIVHLMTNTDIQSLAANREDLTSGMILGLRAGIRTPYLLYAMLAFSARHLAYLAAENNDISKSQSQQPQQKPQQQEQPCESQSVLPSVPWLPQASSLASHSSSMSLASSSSASSASSAPPSTAASPAAPQASPPSTPRYPLPSSFPPLTFSSTPPYVSQSAESAARYQRQAVLLQTRAISLFNTAWRLSHGVIDRSNCVPMLLFSSVLGHHLFADSLSRRDDSLDKFLEHYVQCSQLQRGVHAIATTTWPFLIASEFAPILQWSARFTSRQGRGNDCDRLRQLVDNATEDQLTAADKEACHQAIRLLQVGFDVLFLPAPKDPKPGAKPASAAGNDTAMDETPDEMATTPDTPTGTEIDEDEKAEYTYRHKMILLWALIMPKEFAELLSVKNPESLIILAYYALLLNHGRHLWQVGSAGEYIMGLITDHLGSTWDNWLEYPRHRMATDVVVGPSP
ncbi:hypothetical protein SEUCBS139899_006315 [Sporothrix eucalyptigena]